MIKLQILFLAFIFILISCSTAKKIPHGTDADAGGPHVIMDSMEIITVDDTEMEDERDLIYHPAEDRTWDLLHTMLELSFDWDQSAVIGKATLTLAPVFYPQSSLTLDAVGFNIKKFLVNGKESDKFTYDGNEIVITLTQPATRRDRLTLTIDYVARPRPDYNDESAPITSDQGLYFIDPLDTIPELPRQIWTQGEPSSNRNWYPTIDQPNERGTQEIILTVADSFMTLSNGALISSTKLNNGMRRDHWKLELPHAPYLAMVAVGKWDKVSDSWRGRPVEYYVDPGYGKDARAIFAHTPEMIDFFSERLDFDFVWPKYAQVIVKDFVSGAMENTTAVVFGDFIQFHEEDMLEEGSNDYIVSHELFHHWFGNLVTTESWANITLNEGFANYAEYLWSEYKYGRERADVSRISELSGYFDQASYDAHPLIHYYAEENEVFDAHSYNKGGLVLHMLRDQVGDEAFFASLRLYLQRHAYTAVEVDDLRQAFEEVTGTDLHWFFNQWYFGKGHPVLEVRHQYDASAKQLKVDVTQVQDQQKFLEKFRLPLEIATYYANGNQEVNKVWLEEKTQSFTLDLVDNPVAVVVDPRDILLTVVQQEIPASEYEIRLLRVPAITHRISAFRVMDEISAPALAELLADSSTTLRGLGIQHLVEKRYIDPLYELSKTESNLDLRFFILQSLAELDPQKAKAVAIGLLESTNKNPVIYESLIAIANVDVDAAAMQATRFDNNPSPAIHAAFAAIYAKKGSGASLDFFRNEKSKNISIDYLEEFITSFALYLSRQDAATQQQGMDLIKSGFFLQGPVPQYRRFYVITGLINHYAVESNEAYKENLRLAIKELYGQEKDPYLRDVLKEGFGDILD